MQFDSQPEEPSQFAASWFTQLRKRLALRFILLVGLAVFLTAVGFDSLHQASAADMTINRTESNAVMASMDSRIGLESQPPEPSTATVTATPSSYLSFDAETATRLSHSDLTSASMTRSRLTSSHLFPRIPR